MFKNVGIALGGDWQRALINLSGATKQMRPILQTILPEKEKKKN